MFLGSIGSKIITVLMLPFYTYWLSQSEYGTVDILIIYSTILVGVLSGCISEAIFRLPKGQHPKIQSSYFTTGLLFSGGIFISVYLISKLIIGYFFYNEEGLLIVDYFDFLYWLTAFNFVQTYLQQYCRSVDKIKVYTISGVILTLLMAVLSYLMVPRYGVIGYLYSQILAYVGSIIYTVFFAKLYTYLNIKLIRRKYLKSMLVYSLPMVPNAIIWWVINSLNRPLIEYYVDLSAVGIFAVASKLPFILTTIAGVFFYSWQISVVEEFKSTNFEAFYNKVFKLIFTGLIFVSVMIAVGSYHLTLLISNISYIEAYKYVPILTLGTIFSCMSVVVGANFAASKETIYFLISSVYGAVASLILNVLLIPVWGLYGASISYCVSFFILFLYRVYKSKKYVRLTEPGYYVKSILLNVCVILTLLFISSGYKYILIACWILLYLYLSRKILIDLYCNLLLYIKRSKHAA